MENVKIAWYGKHFGEEPALVGNENQGAGAIFFSGCNLKCVFCQNYQISQDGLGKNYSIEELVKIMLDLQADGAVNIDLVTPTIWWRQLKTAISSAKRNGLVIPIVWNSNAYESVEILKAMDGLVDIYLPDFKYGDDSLAMKFSGAPNYVKIASAAVKEMFRQVGQAEYNQFGLMKRGLIVRHLILPGQVENSLRALEQIAGINRDICVSLMRQYYPVHRAKTFPEINRFVNEKEARAVFDYMCGLGLLNGWTQEGDCQEIWSPNFRKKNPFV
ncbi:radical SAM protein [Candidatus Falkowbacteria bacterium]|nr:radical SAM protein [Candidatus Falkowbacteria bacterium]